MGDASLDLEGVASDGDDGPPQALAGSVVAGGVGAMDTLAVGAQGAAPVAEGAGDTEQRIRLTVPGLPRGNLTVAVLKSRLQIYGGAMFVFDIKTRYKAPNEHIFNKGAIKLREMRCGNSGSSTAPSFSACPGARPRRSLAHPQGPHRSASVPGRSPLDHRACP